jgi:hypothetical protein
LTGTALAKGDSSGAKCRRDNMAEPHILHDVAKMVAKALALARSSVKTVKYPAPL